MSGDSTRLHVARAVLVPADLVKQLVVITSRAISCDVDVRGSAIVRCTGAAALARSTGHVLLPDRIGFRYSTFLSPWFCQYLVFKEYLLLLLSYHQKFVKY